MQVTLEALYADQPPKTKRRLGVMFGGSVALLEQLETQPDQVAFLESEALNDDDRDELICMLGRSSVNSLTTYFQEPVTPWAIANELNPDSEYDTAKDYKEFGEMFGVDEDLFVKSALWRKSQDADVRLFNVFRDYIFLKQQTENDALSIDLPRIIAQFPAEGVCLSPKRLADYSLVTIRSATNANPNGWLAPDSFSTDKHIKYGIYLDTPIGLALTYKGRPQAVIGMMPSLVDRSELVIYQIQGVKGLKTTYLEDGTPDEITKVHARGLMPLAWRKAMICTAEAVAAKACMSVCIQSALNNHWNLEALTCSGIISKIELDAASDPVKRWAQRYDVPAAELGYTQGADNNWRKPNKFLAPK